MKENDIKFISHASMLIKTKENYILTDPWYLTNAFGGWVQSHPARKEDIDFILNIPKDKLFVLVSHGHDDHCDDNFVKHNLSYATPIIAKFPSPGFEIRIRLMFDTEPIIVEEGSTFSHKDFEINTYINKDFTHYDALYTISNGDIFVVHANDNWHEQPNTILQGIENNSKGKKIYYFSQLGIADCYPMMYNLPNDKKLEIIKKRCTKFIEAFNYNSNKISPALMASYANQSTMVNLDSNFPLPYKIIQNMIGDTNIIQMEPGMNINNFKLNKTPETENIFDYCMKGLSLKINEYISKKINTNKKIIITDKETKEPIKENEVIYYAPKNVWQDIFDGYINLEAIIVGGLGKVFIDHNSHIGEIHHLVSKYAYIIQSNIEKEGILKFVK